MNIERLKSRIRGTVIEAFDPAFGATADGLVWNGRKPERRARIIVRADGVDDVQEAVRFAAANGLSVSPRGGGHHFTGLSTAADMVIDLGALDELTIDVDNRRAVAGPAVTNARLAESLGEQGLAFPVGHCGSVPISGYLLGGGVGWNSGAWGIACFSVEAADIVTADGSLRRASATENTDLFWAVRGAGPGFFGIVVSYRLKLQKAPGSIMSTVRIYPLEAAEQVAGWAEAVMADAPANVEFTLKIAAPPPQMGAGDRPCLEAIATVFAPDEVDAKRTLANLGVGAPEPIVVLAELPATFEALYGLIAQSMPQGRRFAVDSLWSEARMTELLPGLAARMAEAPSRDCLAIAVIRSPRSAAPGDAAFSRIGRMFAAVYAIWADGEDDGANIGWMRRTMADAEPISIGSYVGESDLELPARRARIHTPDAAMRLAALRARFDPEGLFGNAVRAERTAAAA